MIIVLLSDCVKIGRGGGIRGLLVYFCCVKIVIYLVIIVICWLVWCIVGIRVYENVSINYWWKFNCKLERIKCSYGFSNSYIDIF